MIILRGILCPRPFPGRPFTLLAWFSSTLPALTPPFLPPILSSLPFFPFLACPVCRLMGYHLLTLSRSLRYPIKASSHSIFLARTYTPPVHVPSWPGSASLCRHCLVPRPHVHVFEHKPGCSALISNSPWLDLKNTLTLSSSHFPHPNRQPHSLYTLPLSFSLPSICFTPCRKCRLLVPSLGRSATAAPSSTISPRHPMPAPCHAPRTARKSVAESSPSTSTHTTAREHRFPNPHRRPRPRLHRHRPRPAQPSTSRCHMRLRRRLI